MSIQQKILSIFLLISFSVISIHTYLSLLSYRTGVEQELNLRSHKALTMVQNLLQGYQESAMARMEEIGRNDRLQIAFLQKDQSYLTSYLQKINAGAKLDFLELRDLNGTIRASMQTNDDESNIVLPYVKQVLQGYTFTATAALQNDVYFLAATNLQGIRGEKIGVITGGYKLNNSLIDEIKRYTGFDIVFYRNDQNKFSSQIGKNYERLQNDALPQHVRETIQTQTGSLRVPACV